jgi:hypothetical protein
LIFNRGLKKDQVGRRNGWGRASHPPLLFFDDGFDWAYLETASTIGAFLYVDHVRLSFLNGIRRAFFRTGSAGHTFIGDHIGHEHHLLQSNEYKTK